MVVDAGALDPYHACNSLGARVSCSLQPFSLTAWPGDITLHVLTGGWAPRQARESENRGLFQLEKNLGLSSIDRK